MDTSELMKKGWFMIPRTFDEWRWYGNSACVHMFIHLMLKANYKSKEWQDIVVERGEVITSLDRLSAELNLSVKQVRTILDKLHKSGCIEKKSTNKYTRIKVVDYDAYQAGNQPSANQQETKEGQTEDNQGATTKKEYKEKKHKKDKKDIYYGYRPTKNFFQDYDNELSEYDYELIRQRLEKDRDNEKHEVKQPLFGVGF